MLLLFFLGGEELKRYNYFWSYEDCNGLVIDFWTSDEQ